jgi:hypothetical protein
MVERDYYARKCESRITDDLLPKLKYEISTPLFTVS